MKPGVATQPHDYRVVCAGYPPPVIVGGQAVNLWAMTYLPEQPQETLVSKDLDVVVDRDGHARLKGLPAWVYEPNETRNWADTRLAFLKGVSDDGRPLLVEVLHSVHGLERVDLEAAVATEFDGVEYRLLDPVVMLKAKAANVRDFPQDGEPPRNDRAHLATIAKCVPRYLEEIRSKAEVTADFQRSAVEIFMRLYRTLQEPKFVATFRAEGIAPSDLLPASLRTSSIARLARLHEFQWPLVEKAFAAMLGPRP